MYQRQAHFILTGFLGRSLALVALTLALLTPGMALAHGGSVHAEVKYRPDPVVAGQPVQFEISLALGDVGAGGPPVEEGQIFVAAEGPDGSMLDEVSLTHQGAGTWTGPLTIPTEGIWSIRTRFDLLAGEAQERFNLRVVPAGEAVADQEGELFLELNPTPTGFALMSYLPLLGLAAVVGLLVAFFLFTPKAQPEEPSSA
jgi:hypothetical protein